MQYQFHCLESKCELVWRAGRSSARRKFARCLRLEKRLLPKPGQAYPVCVEGKRHGPPEDCGGVSGYYSLLEAIGNPLHPQYKESRDWLGDEFDPEAFSVDAVNRRLAPSARRGKR